MADEDKESKTEQPSQRRLDDARKRGQLPISREVTNFLILFVLAITIAGFLPDMMRRELKLLIPFLDHPDQMMADRNSLGIMLAHLAGSTAVVGLTPLLAAVIAVIGAAVAQNGINFSLEPLIPKWEKISPMQGLSRMFSLRSFTEFAKGFLKLLIVGVVGYLSIHSQLGHLRGMMDDGILAVLLFLSHLAVKLMIGVCIAMFFIALADLLYQRFSYVRGLRMSKQELKEEFKQQEGDPQIKQRLRRIRVERAKKRMMADVQKADVVITNPTHFAVALQYEGKSMTAPRVAAKGMDFMALTIRKIAEEHGVTVVENPPLARALYDAVEVDQEIPVQHYKAVAEIISYVWRLKGRLPPQMQQKTAL